MSIRYAYLIALASVVGCASTGSAPGPARNRAVLTEEEIVGAKVTSAYDVIERLRPLWLRSRGESSINTPGTAFPTVYVDSQRYGELSTLRNILASHVSVMRFLTGPEAQGRYGLQNTAGAIDVTMK